MQKIPESYKQAGQTMTLVKRDGNAVMFANSPKSYFEVHRVRVAKAKEAFGRQYPEREVLAGSEEFGSVAFACSTRERAEARFADLAAHVVET